MIALHVGDANSITKIPAININGSTIKMPHPILTPLHIPGCLLIILFFRCLINPRQLNGLINPAHVFNDAAMVGIEKSSNARVLPVVLSERVLQHCPSIGNVDRASLSHDVLWRAIRGCGDGGD